MTIKSDKSKVTLDFECEINKESYLVKFHYTEELGQTISICENSSVSTVYTGYPVDLFTEIVDFLRAQKVIGHSSDIVPSMSKSKDKETITGKEDSPLPLPMPKVDEDTAGDSEVDEVVSIVGDPVQSFSSAKTANTDKKQVVSKNKVIIEDDLDGNDSKIVEERKLAAEKAENSSRKSIKRLDEKEE